MDQTSNYQSILDDNNESTIAIASSAIITKARLKQLVFSAVVIMFVSVGAITLSNTNHSSGVSTSDPSDNPVQSGTFIFPTTRSPTPAPAPTTTTSPSVELPSKGTPEMTPSPTPTPRATASPSRQPGDSSQTFPSEVDAAGKDNDGKSSSSDSSGSRSPSSSSDSPDATAGQSGDGDSNSSAPWSSGSASASVFSTPKPDPSTESPSSSQSPGANSDSSSSASSGADSSFASSSGASSNSSDQELTPPFVVKPGVKKPTPAPTGEIVINSGRVRMPSVPRPTPKSTTLNSPSVSAKPSSSPKPTPKKTITSSQPQQFPQKAKPAALRQPTPTLIPVPTPPPRPSSLPKAAIQDGQEVQPQLTDSNPKEYPQMDCSLPNYISKNGEMFAVGPAGETQQLVIKGVNCDAKVPLGLWSNDRNGSTLFEIASFLARNNFNSVRLPISIESVLANSSPNKALVNANENLVLNLETYMTTLQGIIKGLAQQQISVLISLQTLSPSDAGLLWYNNEVSEGLYLDAIDTLTSNLCSKDYWNVLGLDLKNEPAQSTWGDDSDTDFRAAATHMGNQMLDGCSKWLAFVEGNSESREWTSPATGKQYLFEDWWGGGLSKAKELPVTLSIPDKVVYAPHYFSPSVYPSSYFYQKDGITELSNKELEENIKGTFDAMFGYLAKEPESPALVLGEFGGLFASDAHPKKTSQRAIDYTTKLISQTSGFAGGYVSLNPETGFDYNFVKAQPGSQFHEGLVQSDWRTANEPLLKALESMDSMSNLSKLQCFKKKFRLRR